MYASVRQQTHAKACWPRNAASSGFCSLFPRRQLSPRKITLEAAIHSVRHPCQLDPGPSAAAASPAGGNDTRHDPHRGSRGRRNRVRRAARVLHADRGIRRCLRLRQGDDELRRRPAGRADRAQARAALRLAGRLAHSGSYLLRPVLGMDCFLNRAAGCESGPDLVNDADRQARHHAGRPARAGHWSQ